MAEDDGLGIPALASGVEIVTFDGPLDTVDRLWRLAAGAGVTVLGTSPAYLRLCEEAGLRPGRDLGLGALRALLSTGAVLPEGAYHWVRSCVGPVQVQSICGGTDILGCFVLGHPDLPVRRGLAQCRSLGMDVQAWEEGAPLPPGRVGQLVCANPFPSRPLGFDGRVPGQYLLDPDAYGTGYALGYAAGVLSRTLVAQRTGESLVAAAAQPASIAAFTALNVISWRRHLSGTASWKGRAV